MKKLLKNIWCTGIFLMFIGCDDYLDIKTPGIVSESLMFEDLQGYRDAMYGIYSTMRSSDLYGKALSYDFIDDLAQLYRDGAKGKNVMLKKRIQYDYSNVGVRSVIDGIWSKTYRLISAANNVLKHHTKGLTLLDSTETVEYNLIKGEALAVRAFMHFTLARLFCQNIINNPEATGIPYATEFSLKPPVTRSLSEIYELIIKDLVEAEKWLKADEKNDITAMENTYIGYLLNRYAHLNLYAVKAILARVYLTKGDYSPAAKYAREVIDSEKFALNKPDSINRYKRYSPGLGNSNEFIFVLHDKSAYLRMQNKFLLIDSSKFGFKSAERVLVRADLDDIYEKGKFTADSYDRRYQAYFYFVGAHSDLEGMGFKRLTELPRPRVPGYEIPNILTNGITLIRLPEMYYILSESLYDTDPAAAIKYFNKVRNSRGLADIEEQAVMTRDLFIKEILKERLKEFWGEGLIFYDYKRLNRNIKGIDGNIINAADVGYVFPLPENEIEFGK